MNALSNKVNQSYALLYKQDPVCDMIFHPPLYFDKVKVESCCIHGFPFSYMILEREVVEACQLIMTSKF
jgi:hypothetical protein